MLSNKQLEMRTTGIGASEAGIIAGLAPDHWQNDRLSIYVSKVAPSPKEETVNMWLGNQMEPVLALRYRLNHPELTVRRCGTTYRDKTRKWMLATPDAFVTPAEGKRWGLELKTVWSWEEAQMWGEAGDQIPLAYLCQVYWCMEVMGLDRWDVLAFIAPFRTDKFRTYTIERDQVLIDRLVEINKDFWFENVEKRIPPDPSGKMSSNRALQTLYGQDDGIEMPADADMAEWGDELLGAVDELRAAEKDVELLKQRFKARMGETSKVVGDGWNVTWKTDKRGRRTFKFNPINAQNN